MSGKLISRRSLLRTAAFGAAGASLGLAPWRMARAADLTIGIVYVGARDDFGWNQAHAVAVKALKELPGVKVVEEENVPETDAVSKTMELMINLDGAGLILATSFGYYTPFVVDLAKKYPDVEFRHAAPLWNKDKDPKNAGSYFGYLNQAPLRRRRRRGPLDQDQQDRLRRRQADRQRAEQHQFGAAGRALGQSERERAGDLHRRLVAARCARRKPPTRWSTPAATSSPAMSTGPRSSSRRRRSAASRPAATTPARRRSRPRASSPAPNTSGRRSTRATPTTSKGGKTLPNFTAGGYEADFVQNTPFGAGCSPEGRKPALAAIDGLKAKQADLCRPAQGQQDGKVVIDKTYDNLDPFLDKMDYLLEGVVGSTDLRRVAPDVGRASGVRSAPRASPLRRPGRIGARAARRRGICRDPAARACDRGVLLFALFLLAIGKSPVDFVYYVWRGGFGTAFSFQNTLQRSSPLILTALAVAIPARIGLIMIGGEGALVLGGFVAAALSRSR